MIMRPSQILKKHQVEILKIMHRYPMLSNLRVVGSVARGEDTEESDSDFLVDPDPDTTLFDMGGLIHDLEELLCIKVDLISSRGIKNEYIQASFAKDAVRL
jgi:predicted nucleotidyltransferase